ncbi:hypothetical protein [Paenibacillus polymyxa]|uniref:Uncharacterized protein n=1 Tax=Paenibacillus polymyxa (strain SC2) TaxID=886882 RepID=E3EKG6_PAEPS|nr:hypothetical protein [Paenibacillus polymyxa]ADO59798.1 hypothetical protein PPSC2_26170 [Paenibacillus polymyxa SC2]WPQ59967.1 hypothetical protein SKN87_27375 [Paenibacillus polymyxa]
MNQKEKCFLQVGDVFVVKEGMKVNAEVPSKFIFSNCRMPNTTRKTKIVIGSLLKNKMDVEATAHELKKKIVDSIASVCGAVANPMAVQHLVSSVINSYEEETLDTTIFCGEYLVVNTTFDGGCGGHDPYPNGHHVFCRKLKDGKYDPNGSQIDFYQSGSFTALITPESVQPIRKMTMRFI